jgi:hypothetical protein
VKLRVGDVGMGVGVGGCLLSWAAGATRTAAVVGGTLTSTAADDGRPAGRAPAATARRSTGVRAGVRLDAVGVTGCACSRLGIAAAVQTPARTRRTSNRDAAGGGRRPARRVLHAVWPRADLVAVAAPCGRRRAWRVRSAPGRLPISSQHHESGQSEYLASIPLPRKKVRRSAAEDPPSRLSRTQGAAEAMRAGCATVAPGQAVCWGGCSGSALRTGGRHQGAGRPSW